MKNIFIVILVLIIVALLVLVVSFYQKANKYTKSLEEERYSRMVAEESLQRSSGKLATLETQLKSANEKIEKIQTLIKQEKNVNSDLQKQYEALNKIKAELEDKLKTTTQKIEGESPQAVEINNTAVPQVEAAK